jgi:hypothetical protein
MRSMISDDEPFKDLLSSQVVASYNKVPGRPTVTARQVFAPKRKPATARGAKRKAYMKAYNAAYYRRTGK